MVNDNLLNQVDIEVQQLREGFLSPLRKFRGTLEKTEATLDERSNRVVVMLYFKDLKDVEATEPYPFPVAQIRVPTSNQARSSWGFLKKSIATALPDSKGLVRAIVGKEVLMEVVPENFGRFRGEAEDRIVECWEVKKVFGEISEDLYTLAYKKAVGCSMDDLQPFYQAVLAAPEFKSDAGLKVKSEILQKKETFIKEAIDKGILTVTDDGYITMGG